MTGDKCTKTDEYVARLLFHNAVDDPLVVSARAHVEGCNKCRSMYQKLTTVVERCEAAFELPPMPTWDSVALARRIGRIRSSAEAEAGLETVAAARSASEVASHLPAELAEQKPQVSTHLLAANQDSVMSRPSERPLWYSKQRRNIIDAVGFFEELRSNSFFDESVQDLVESAREAAALLFHARTTRLLRSLVS